MKPTKTLKIHPSITFARVEDAMNADDYLGFCIACGAEADDSVEPDAHDYPCEACGKNAVYGAEEIMLQFGESLA